MKKENIFSTILFLAGIIALTGCDEQLLTVDETPIIATAEAGMYSIEISSNGAWTAVVEDAANHAWCTLSSASGSNDGKTIIVHVAENTLDTTRSATVRITLGSLTKFVVVNQEAAEETGEYPIEIPFEEYSLAETSCQWTIPFNSNATIIINSNEELENYISCSSYPAIDFAEYTLLVAHGPSTAQPAHVLKTTLLKNSMDKYTLKLVVFSGIQAAPSRWYYAILISKITNEADISLDVTYK